MDIILSIKPKYADLILSGQKTIELRRRFAKYCDDSDRIYLYASSPIKSVVGYLQYCKIERYNTNITYLKNLIEQLQLTWNEIEDYLKGSYSYVYIQIRDYKKFEEPIPLSEFGIKNPPQNFCYIDYKQRADVKRMYIEYFKNKSNNNNEE